MQYLLPPLKQLETVGNSGIKFIQSLTTRIQKTRQRMKADIYYVLFIFCLFTKGGAVDCNGRCACCIDGESGCGTKAGLKDDTICLKGCVDTIYGHRCKNPCKEHCLRCSQDTGSDCSACKPGYFGTLTHCTESCPSRCLNNTCEQNGSCICIPNSEGNKCETCVQGLYGDNCDKECAYRNCRCTEQNNCISCKDKYTGEFCQNTCSIGCTDATCNRNGSCSCLHNFIGQTCDVCASNYDGSACDSCIPGKYGDRCQHNCASPNCHCIPSPTCVSCVSGFYGTACHIPCSQGCLDNTCSGDGSCTCKHNFAGAKCDVCAANYEGDTCNICVQGKYGYLCQNTCTYSNCRCRQQYGCDSCKTEFYGIRSFCETPCGKGCVSATCEDDGSCACLPNFMEPNCENCKSGFFGYTCNRTCFYRNCKCTDEYNCDDCREGTFNISSNCNHLCSEGCLSGCQHDGSCNCKHSFNGIRCDNCDDGFYGQDCSQSCSLVDSNCLKCKRNDGYCMKCKNGFFLSNRHCIACGINCLEDYCDPTNGRCTLGCKAGFWSDICDANCNLNCSSCDQFSSVCLNCTTDVVFGPSCNTSCNSSCVQSRCHHETGKCSHGCIHNRHGSYCENECPENCEHKDGESPCNGSGVCTNGCVGGYIGSFCSIAKNEAVSAGTPVGVIAGGVSGGVVVIIVAVVAIFLLRRRSHRLPASNKIKRNGNKPSQPIFSDERVKESPTNERTYYNEGQIKRASTKAYSSSTQPPAIKSIPTKQRAIAHVKTASERGIDLEMDDESNRVVANNSKKDQTYYNEAESSTNKSMIPVGQLVKYVDGKTDEAYSADFETFSHGLVKPYEDSQKRENVTKNRYKGIYPYDDSRVKVTDNGGSDYINASYIDGYKKPKQYIATLGPMSQQLGDFSLFWKMIWQQRVEKIVMVTNLIEQGSPKCEQYWPDHGTTKTYGDIKVESRSEDEYAEFTRRTFTMTMANLPECCPVNQFAMCEYLCLCHEVNWKKCKLTVESEERMLHHLHFTCWPDKAIPDDVTAMIEFRQRVLSTPSTLNGPMVVHCSAGVGRTGTYIALDILTNEGEAKKAIDIPGCVHKMRQNRPNMVQTVGQYQFLHTAAVYSLTFDCKQIKGENFKEYMNKQPSPVLNSQFKHLQHTVETRSKDETAAVERNKQHLSKNRANADIPGNENRPRLYLNLKPGASDYINAVYIHSFRMTNRYLVAQTPLPETIIDFLTLAVQERCSCIVSFEADMDKQRNIGIYYPAANQEVLKKGTFQVSSSREENKTFYTERTLTIQHKGTSTHRTFPHLQFTDWDEMENIPRSTTNFLSFLNIIENVMKQQDDGPILVHCFDGAGKSGLFCVVSLLLHKMAVEHEVSVLNAVRKVKTTRRLAIPNQEQFVFCHGCVTEYLRSFDVYANFTDETGQL